MARVTANAYYHSVRVTPFIWSNMPKSHPNHTLSHTSSHIPHTQITRHHTFITPTIELVLDDVVEDLEKEEHQVVVGLVCN